MLTIMILLFLLVSAVELTLERLNLHHQRRYGRTLPEEFSGAFDAQKLERAIGYALARGRIGLVESLIGKLALGLFIFGGLLPRYDRLVVGVTGSFIADGVLFVLGLMFVSALLGIPFSLWRTFGVEARFGFNTTTLPLWCVDFAKSLLVGTILLAVLSGGALTLVAWTPHFWWLWVWGFFASMTVVLIYLSPQLIEPLFFKFEPVTRSGLEAELRTLAGQAGIRVTAVRQVDASRRSKHSNAYFTGIGRVKRIVLFDTLLDQLDNREVLAVLAHEIGHWKKKHILKRLARMHLISLAVCYAAYRLLAGGEVPTAIGLEHGSFYLQCTVLVFAGGLLTFFATPLGSRRSRRDEEEADDVACELLSDGAALAAGLVKLSAENLASLHPHPWYAWFYYSHPPLVSRVRRLRRGR